MNAPDQHSDVMAKLSAAAVEVAMAPLPAQTGWIVYLLKELEALETYGDYDETLERVQTAIARRLERGSW